MAQIRPARRGFKKLPLDPKDRERVDRVLAATDLDTGERIDLVYGEDSPSRMGERTPAETTPQRSPSAASDQAPGPTTADPGATVADVIDGEATEIPFEGEEPPVVSDEPAPTEEPVFTSGRYAGKTVAEVFAAGKDGLSYARWAFGSWKTEPLRGALDRFAETHPEIKS